MRLWHKNLIPLLPRPQLLGQHRECCALRGRGWGRKHRTVDYVFEHPYSCLFRFHQFVMEEMKDRGYSVSPEWLNPNYRGKSLGYCEIDSDNGYDYPEHDEQYLRECLENLGQKGVDL